MMPRQMLVTEPVLLPGLSPGLNPSYRVNKTKLLVPKLLERLRRRCSSLNQFRS